LHRRQADERRRRAEEAAHRRSRVTPLPRVLRCAGQTTAIADPVADVHVQADTASRAAKKALARGADLRRASFTVSGKTVCATATFARHPTVGRLSFGLWLRDAGGRPLAVEAVYVDFEADGVHAGRVGGSSTALDPTGVRVGISGTRVSVRFALDRWKTARPQPERLAWRVSISAFLKNRPLGASDSVPSDRRGRPRLVRQSDGRLVPAY
jgi:hypothetical protein